MGRKASRKRKRDITDLTTVVARGGEETGGMPSLPQVISGKTILHLLVIAFVGLIAYSNTFHSPFMFDDEGQITDNPIIKNLGDFFSKGYEYNPRRFIGYFTFAFNYHFGELSVTGYHIVNLAIHMLNGILVYFLVTLTFKAISNQPSAISNQQNPPSSPFSKGGHEGDLSRFTIHDSRFIALFSALLFVAHPIQTQAVTYIVQRFASLATMFYLLSVVFYIKGRLVSVKAAISHQPSAISHNPPSSPLSLRGDRGGLRFTVSAGWYLLSMISAVLAMKTKEIAFTLPIVIIVYEFIFFRSSLRKKLLFLIPVILTLMIIPISILGVNKPLGEILTDLSEKTRLQTDVTRWDYMFTEIRVITTYIRLIFLPINQNLDYDYPIYHSFFTPPVFFSFLFLSSLFATAVYLLYKTHRAKSIGHSAISDQQSAISNNPPLSPLNLRGELKGGYSRFTIHISPLIAFGIFWFFITLSVESSIIPIADVIFEHRVYLPSVGIFVALVAAVSVAVQKFFPKRNTVIVLLSIVVSILSLAAYSRNSLWKSPILLWEDTASKSPHNIRPFYNLGNEYAKIGEFGKAVDAYSTAMRIMPETYHLSGKYKKEYAQIYNNLGSAYGDLRRYNEAIEIFKKVVANYPGFLEAYNNLGAAYINSRRYKEAVEVLSEAIDKDPVDIGAHYNLALAFLGAGDHANAHKEYVLVKQLSPEQASHLPASIQ